MRCSSLDDVVSVLNQLKIEFPHPTTISFLQSNKQLIDDCFNGNTVEEIFSKLRNNNSSWASDTLNTLSKKSPTSLKLELECIKRGSKLNIQQVRDMDYNVAMQ